MRVGWCAIVFAILAGCARVTEEQLDSLDIRVGKVEADVKAMATTSDELAGRVTALEDRVGAMPEACAGRVKEATDRVAEEARADLQKLEGRTKALEATCADLSKALPSLRDLAGQTATKAEASAAELKKEVAALAVRLAELEKAAKKGTAPPAPPGPRAEGGAPE